MSFTCGDKLKPILTTPDIKIRICIHHRRNRQGSVTLMYMDYDLQTGRSSLNTDTNPCEYEPEFGELGHIGEKIRCLRQGVCGQVLRKHNNGTILFCETELGNYFITHRHFAIDFINTTLCYELSCEGWSYSTVKRGSSKRSRSDAMLQEELTEQDEFQWPLMITNTPVRNR